jgi:hypothetical protein
MWGYPLSTIALFGNRLLPARYSLSNRFAAAKRLLN